MAEASDFPPVTRPDGWSTVEVRDEAGRPATRFWVKARTAGSVAMKAHIPSVNTLAETSATPVMKAAPKVAAFPRRNHD